METVYVRMTRFNLSELNCCSLRFVILNCNLQSSLIYYNLDCSSRCPHPYVFVRACMRARVGVRLCACVHVCISRQQILSSFYISISRIASHTYWTVLLLQSSVVLERHLVVNVGSGTTCCDWWLFSLQVILSALLRFLRWQMTISSFFHTPVWWYKIM